MPYTDQWLKVFDTDAESTPYIAVLDDGALAGSYSVVFGSAPVTGRWMSGLMLRPQHIASPAQVVLQALLSVDGTDSAGKRLGFACYTEKSDIVNDTGSLYTIYLEHEGATERVVLAESTDGITTPTILAQSAQTLTLGSTYALKVTATISGSDLVFVVDFGASFASMSQVINHTDTSALRLTSHTSGLFARSYVASQRFIGRADDFTIDSAV